MEYNYEDHNLDATGISQGNTSGILLLNYWTHNLNNYSVKVGISFFLLQKNDRKYAVQ